MKKDIIISGVGGQGIVSMAAIIGTAALESGLNLKQSEVHGMSQRGGDVLSNLRYSDKPIASDLIPEGKADMIISIEPLEALRHLPRLSMEGWIITNTIPFNNIENYPDIDGIISEVRKIPNHILVDADTIAKDLNARRSTNVIILGAASEHLGFELAVLENAIIKLFEKKGSKVIDQNITAFYKGRELAHS